MTNFQNENGDFLNSFFFWIEELIDNELFQTTVQQSLDSYYQEIFKKVDLCPQDLEEFIVTEKDLENVKEETNCFICLETLEVGQIVSQLKCNHIFHTPCLKNLIEHQHKQCPLCRESIEIKKRDISEQLTTKDGHQISFF